MANTHQFVGEAHEWEKPPAISPLLCAHRIARHQFPETVSFLHAGELVKRAPSANQNQTLLAFNEHLLRASHCAKHVTCIVSLNLRNPRGNYSCHHFYVWETLCFLLASCKMRKYATARFYQRLSFNKQGRRQSPHKKGVWVAQSAIVICLHGNDFT